MNTPVLSTPRKTPTALQQLKLLERQRHVCPLCHQLIKAREPTIAEHMTPLGLGGSNDDGNLAIVHEGCAKVKTAIDVQAIAKAKRLKASHYGLKTPPRVKIASAGFAKKEKPQKLPLPKQQGIYS